MKGLLECYKLNKAIPEYPPSYLDQTSSCSELNNVRLLVPTKEEKCHNEHIKHATNNYYRFNSNSLKRQKYVSKTTNENIMSKTNCNTKTSKHEITHSDGIVKEKCSSFGVNYVISVASEHSYHDSVQHLSSINPIQCKVYRCELDTDEVQYCTACNSQMMFEVIRSLYDCYTRKTCDNCNCILCGTFFREKRRLARSKSVHQIASVKNIEERIKQTERAMMGKTAPEKEKLLKDLALAGVPLPDGKTASEKAIINKVRKNLGIPPTPKTASEKEKMKKAAELGLLQPLIGKSRPQKEKILQNLADMHIPLPEGRTPSEKALIQKIKAAAGPPPDSLSEKLRKAKVAGLLTPLAGKSPQRKKDILKGLALAGLPLPDVKSPSEQKLMNEIRSELGLPPTPKTPAMKEKYAKAADIGLMQPLEGKSPQEKERILTRLADMGIPLPAGRSPSEKALIARIKAEPRRYSTLAPSEKIRKAKAAGLITPLKSKTPEQREKILNGLASLGIPLPEGTTDSEKNLINRVRNNLGLPPEPKTPAMRDKHKKAADAGLLQPLEGKTPREKERILRGLKDLGIPLPEGRTPSEKTVINKIKAEPRIPSMLSPTEKMRKAKAAGLITPLKGKTPEQREKILTGLASLGIPLPEGKTESEKKIINNVRNNLGLPPEPKTQPMKDKYAKAADAGLLQPLEGKTVKEKEKILRGLNNMGIPLPEGRTPSEKALITKIKAEPAVPPILAPLEKMRKAKEAGLITPLKGKTPEHRKNILKGLANLGIPLPEGKTDSEKKIIDNVRKNLGLPPEPKTPAMKDKYAKAADAGLIQPLEGKTSKEKEKILRDLNNIGIPLPEGRTPSEKALITKIEAEPILPPVSPPSEKMRKARDAGLITPLKGKTPAQREKILKGLANLGIPLPEGQTDSEKKIISNVRNNLGLPPEPETPDMKDKHTKAADAGFLQPLEGKTPKEKERILRGLNNIGISLPEGRTPSEKALISKIKAEPRAPSILTPSEKMRKAKEAGLITSLKSKTTEQREKILKGLANLGMPLPEGKTDSEKKIIDSVRNNLGLPPEPKTPDMKDKHTKAADAGFLQPLEGKTPNEKERILRGLNDIGIPLPEGRTASEKALITKIKAEPRALSILTPLEKMRKAKEAGLMTPLSGKTPEQREKILKGLANLGIPFPEGKTDSENKIIDNVRNSLGLPPEPKTPDMKDKYKKAADAGFLQPLEGKTPKEKEKILRGLNNIGIPMPEGRTPSEKALITKIKAEPRAPSLMAPPEKMRKAQDAGLITPLKGKTPEQKENILKGLANLGIPLPEGKTKSEKKIINKMRTYLGLPPEPKTPDMKQKHVKAADAGLLQPLEGKSPKEKEKNLRGLNDMGIPLPEGRTPSERALITKIEAEPRAPPILAPSEKIRRAKVAGLITPLKGKTPAQRENILKGLASLGIPLPEGTTDSEKNLINNVRANIGLPPEPKTPDMKEKHKKAADAGLLQPLEGKTPKEKERILRGLNENGIPLPEGRTLSEKNLINKIKTERRTPSEKMRKAKDEGLFTPLKGKTPEQKENILKRLAGIGLPLPEGKTKSEKKIINKVRADLGLPPEPKTPSMKEKHAKAADAGLLEPLEGKTPKEKEKVLRGLQNAGIPLPEGRTQSEKDLVNKIKAEPPMITASEKMRRAKDAGLITPLKGKTPEQKENILKGLANLGIPLPEGKTESEKKVINKVRADLGLPPEPKTPNMKAKHAKAADAGLLQPLEGKTPKEKERILRGLHDMEIPLTEGRTPSEKALIIKIMEEPRAPPVLAPSEKMRRAKVAGLITPLSDKTPEQRQKILKGLASLGIPLPEGTTDSEKKIINKVRADLGLPPEPKTSEMKDKHTKAAEAGILQPLQGRTPKEKEKILRGLNDMGIPLPEGRTPSEKALITKIKAESRPPTILAPSEKMRRAKVAGLTTPLKGKTPEQREKILKGLASLGMPLPKGTSDSEKDIINKVRNNLGLPPEPKTPDMENKHAKAADAGLLQPLEGKTPKEKERILRGLNEIGITLPEGRTPSEKALISKIKLEPRAPSILAPSEKMRRAKVAGLITPLKDKSPKQKEKLLKGLANLGIPLPEGTTNSEKKIINKVRANLGLPPEPKTSAMKNKHEKAAEVGILQPLEGKPPKEKERILRGLKNIGIPLPQGRTPSEKALISKIKAEPHVPSILAPTEKMRKAAALGLITPLTDKTPEQKQKILKGLANLGIPLPEGTTGSEKKLINAIRADLGLPPEPKTHAMKDKHAKAAEAGLLQPLEGKPLKEKERILKGLNNMGIPLPEGRTPSEKALITKIKAEPRAPSILAPSEKLRRAKVAGLITSLQDKTPEQNQNILRGLANLGIPLPEGITDSQKKLINKVRNDLGLPPEPKNRAMKDKHVKAADAGFLQPLEGKTAPEKERILRGLNNMGIPLPEGRTLSEKALIAKIKAESRAPTILAPSEKLRKAKVAGLITPLEGKTPEQKEKILTGLANLGISLPEGKTRSEKRLINKVRNNLGLPPEPKNSAMRINHTKAADAGLLQPLEGKTHKEKERILRGLNNIGIPLPRGRTHSEEDLISRIKAEPTTLSGQMRKAKAATHLVPSKSEAFEGPVDECICKPEMYSSVDIHVTSKLALSERLRMAKAAGLFTPIEGKLPEQKESILRGLAIHGLSLPEGKTDSDKKLIDKVRADLGLPPEPETPEMKAKYEKAAHDGILEPLEGKLPKEKEKILEGLTKMGIPLPEGRSPSEKSLIAKIKDKMRKLGGLLTPLEGKTPKQKEKILKNLAMHGVPLPEGTTDSEKKLIEDIRVNLGLPPEPDTPEMRDKHAKAADAGLLQPLTGKSPKEKERILKGLLDMGIPLPEGRTHSEESLIAKVKAPVEKLHKAKAAGVLTPLKGKTPKQKDKILKGLAMHGIPLPEGITDSEKKLIADTRSKLGLPPEPSTPEMRDKHAKAADAGFLQPLEGKTNKEKEKILKGLIDMGIPLPKGRTPSEEALIAKAKELEERMRKAKATGLLTPLKGKTPKQKQKILKGLAMHGIPLPEGTTDSEKKLIEDTRASLGLPPEPDTPKMRDKHAEAAHAGLLQPLEGKSPTEKENILKGLASMGIPLPEGRTSSEKLLIAKVKAPTASEKLRKAKAAGLLTPLKGKSQKQKENILKGLAMQGIPLPTGTTDSENKLIEETRAKLGLPPAPETPEMKDKHAKAAEAGLLQPLTGKTLVEKEKILKGLADMGIPLPKGRTPSEKTLIAKVKEAAEKLHRVKAAGLLTPLAGKTPKQKEKILKGLAMHGILLPEGATDSEKKLIEDTRASLGLPPEPDSPEMRNKHAKAADAGLLQPLEGKSPEEKEKLLKGLARMGIPLPEGRTPSEKSLIAKVKVPTTSEKLRRAKSAGLLTPLKGKTQKQKENILKGLAMQGIPLPAGTTDSEKKLIEDTRAKLGLPPAPDTPEMKDKHAKAAEIGLLQPLTGKTPVEKEKILKGLADMGIPLPKGRTQSEITLIAKVKEAAEKLHRAKAAGLLTPLTGKTPKQKEKILKGLAMHGILLPEGATDSEKKLIEDTRASLGLPPEPDSPEMRNKHAKAADAGLLQPLEGKSPEEKEKILKGLAKMGIPLPEGRTPSEKSLIIKIKVPTPSEKIRRAKSAGLLTPLKGKTQKQKEHILKGLAMQGLPLPTGTTVSDTKLIEDIRASLGLPPEPDTPEMRDKHAKAADAGFLQPLLGKTPAEKEKILKGLAKIGIPLPEGRTPSEKSLIAKVKKEINLPSVLVPSEKLRRAKAAGLLTPLIDKTPEQKENILKGLAMYGIPLPKATTESEKKLIEDTRASLGLPPDPDTREMRDKHAKAANAGLLQPLLDKTPAEKEKILRGLAKMDIPLPEGRTQSEKSLIAKVKKEIHLPSVLEPSEKMRRAEAAGLFTPLEGKTPKQREKILKGLAMHGIPLPEATTDSEKKLIEETRASLGLPPEPETPEMRDKHTKAAEAGILLPLEGKSPKEKEKILRGLANMGIPLPEGRTPSEKSLIAKVKEELHLPTVLEPSEKMRRAKAAGFVTPLEGKTPKQKEKILKGLAMHGIPLPEATTDSEKKLIEDTRASLGLPPEPETPEMRDKHARAAKAGILLPLDGKSPKEKEKILRGLANMGIPLPEGRTPSEKSLITRLNSELRPPTITTEKLKAAKEAGLSTLLEGKSPKEKEKILKNLAKKGLPLPEGKTFSDVALIDKIKKEYKIPEKSPEEKVRRAKSAGFLTPLEGKTPEQKEKILRGRAAAGLPLPIGKTPSERDLINKIKDSIGYVTPSPSEREKRAKAAGLITPLTGKSPSKKIEILKDMLAAGVPIPEGTTPSDIELIKRVTTPKKTKSEKLREAKTAGLLTPLAGKTPEQKENIIRGLIKVGLPLPEAETPSDKSLMDRIRIETGLPPEPETSSIKAKYKKAQTDGLITPLEGKLPAEKKGILKRLIDAGIPLPQGRTSSEKSLIKQLKQKASKKSVCDHACGCDKKKIKFKHSYVRIRVISPDISSICDCPNECLPTKPSGVVVDNEGIKVTIGTVIGVPSALSTEHNNIVPNLIKNKCNNKISSISVRKQLSIDTMKVIFDQMQRKGRLVNRIYSADSFEASPSGDDSNYTRNNSPIYFSDRNDSINSSIRSYSLENCFERYRNFSRYLLSTSDIYRTYYSNDNDEESSDDSLTSILIVKSDTSLSMTSSASSSYTESFVSYLGDTTSAFTQYSDTESYSHFSDTTMEYSGSTTNNYFTEDETESGSIRFLHEFASARRIGDVYNKYNQITQANIICYRLSQIKLNKSISPKLKTKVCQSAIVIK